MWTKNIGFLTRTVVAFMAFAATTLMLGCDESAESKMPVTAVQKKAREVVMGSVQLKNFSWTKGFENLMLVNFTVENTGDRSVTDLEFSCVHTAKSGAVIDRNKKVIDDTIPAKGTKTFKDFNMGILDRQVERSSCSITHFKII